MTENVKLPRPRKDKTEQNTIKFSPSKSLIPLSIKSKKLFGKYKNKCRFPIKLREYIKIINSP